MAEVITGFQTAIVSPCGDEVTCRVLAEQLAKRICGKHGSSSFGRRCARCAADEDGNHQPTRDDVVHWAGDFPSETYSEAVRLGVRNDGQRRPPSCDGLPDDDRNRGRCSIRSIRRVVVRHERASRSASRAHPP